MFLLEKRFYKYTYFFREKCYCAMKFLLCNRPVLRGSVKQASSRSDLEHRFEIFLDRSLISDILKLQSVLTLEYIPGLRLSREKLYKQ